MTPQDVLLAMGLLGLLYVVIAYFLRPSKLWDFSQDDEPDDDD